MNPSSLDNLTLAFVGGGNMARSLVGGALEAGVAAANIRIGEPSAERRARLDAEFGVACTDSNGDAVDGADLVVVAVKPQVAAEAVRAITSRIDGHAVVISIMAGIRSGDLRRWLGAGPSLVRCMPNTPALIGFGMTVLYAAPGLPEAARERATALLGAVGETAWVDNEDQLDAVTAVSGSGPAYFFLVTEALQAAGVAAGLPADVAATLARQTARGAAEMAAAGGDVAELRRQVTSPGGTTAAAVAELEASGLRDAFTRAVRAATERSRELADEYGGQ
ncbi:MAG: pyrroline-5-carboxylate reductase [Gammaproteobacteria bacterium]